MTIKTWTVAAMLCAAAAACAAGRKPATAKTAEKKMTTNLEWKSQNGGPMEAGAEVAADQAAWERAWLKVGQDAPALDFKKFVGVVVFIGEKPTGGYTVVFDEPVIKGDDLIVRYRVPKPSGFTTQAFTHPWKARAFPRPAGRLILEAY
jgi:hypothetical protein